jgi:hypothetical protein
MIRTRWMWVLFAVTLFASPRAHGGSTVFKEQLLDYADKAAAVLAKVAGRKQAYAAKEAVDFATDNLAAITLIHRLQETVAETNVHEIQRSGKPDRELLLVSQGCIAVEFLRNSIANYGATGDRAFITLASDGAVLVRSVRKQLGP